MKTLLAVGGFCAAALSAQAVVLGDSYQQVLAEKGQPSGKMEAGGTQILRYGDQTIKLRSGVVVAVEGGKGTPSPSASAPAPVASRPAESPAAAPAPKAGRAPTADLWVTDYPAAVRVAKEWDRKVFVFFTGSDWCGWCMKLKAEVLATPEFDRFARENLILVELDYPKGKPQSAELKTQNAKLAREYGISGYPTVVVLNSAGKKIGEMGYQPGGPGPFIAALKKL
jgi:protein disulfide-isomerase